jgi:hypothetical protein
VAFVHGLAATRKFLVHAAQMEFSPFHFEPTTLGLFGIHGLHAEPFGGK